MHIYQPCSKVVVTHDLLGTEISKSHLNNHYYRHYGMKTSSVTPSFYSVFNVSLSCINSIPSFIGNLWQVFLLANHLHQTIWATTQNYLIIRSPESWQKLTENYSTFILPTSSRLPWVFATSVDKKKSEENLKGSKNIIISWKRAQK